MAYAFKGIFSRAPDIDRRALRDGHVVREIAAPFSGFGILAMDLNGSFDACGAYLDALGIAEHDWLYLDYVTWAGPVDRVLALGARAGTRFGPIQADGHPAEDAFLAALRGFGLDPDGTCFAPFERGFWGVL